MSDWTSRGIEAEGCTIQVGGTRAKRRGVALVDHADVEAISAYSWRMDSDGYAVRNAQIGGKRLVVRMHREILGLDFDDRRRVDHIHGNKLDNRRANLRICTNAQNLQNRHNRPYRGASWHAGNKLWQASAMLDGRRHSLGYFATREEAAAAASAFRCQHMPFSRDARTHES